MKETYTTIEFRVDGEVVESVEHESVPSVGDTVEVGAKFDGGERIDPGIAEGRAWFKADYKTVLTGEVESVKRHYHSSLDRNEQTVYVELADADTGDAGGGRE